MATDKEKLEEAVQGIYSGSISAKIKKNSSYAITGMFIGGVVGMMIASFMGQSKLVGIAVGASVSGLGGYLIANGSKKEEEL